MIKAYHRVTTIEEALQLLGRSGVQTAVLTGYDAVVNDEVDEVIDLQAVPLKRIEIGESSAAIDALVTLQALVDAARLPTWLRAAAQSEEPNTLRAMRSIAGVILEADPESLLLAALLAADAQVMVQSPEGMHTGSLSDYLTDRSSGLPVRLGIPLTGEVRTAKVSRTPADKPIVAAAGYSGASGARLALCGVASTPIVIDPANLDALVPPADFRGSSSYRKQMAHVLSRRVLDRS